MGVAVRGLPGHFAGGILNGFVVSRCGRLESRGVAPATARACARLSLGDGERARALALGELRRAASDLNSAADRVERFDTALLSAAGRSNQAAEFAFERGASSVLEVLDARRTFRSVQVEALAARDDYARAFAFWRAAQATAPVLEDK